MQKVISNKEIISKKREGLIKNIENLNKDILALKNNIEAVRQNNIEISRETFLLTHTYNIYIKQIRDKINKIITKCSNLHDNVIILGKTESSKHISKIIHKYQSTLTFRTKNYKDQDTLILYTAATFNNRLKQSNKMLDEIKEYISKNVPEIDIIVAQNSVMYDKLYDQFKDKLSNILKYDVNLQ